MEHNIKNFDRAIEQRMNEAEVAPPFGAWNRIAAEMEATAPVAPATPAPASVIPGRGLMTLVAGALLLGISIATIYLGQVSEDRKENKAAVIAAPSISTPQIVSHLSAPFTEMKPAVTPVIAKSETYVRAVKAIDPAVRPIVEKTAISDVATPPVVTPSLPANAFTEVPAPSQPVAKNAKADAGQVYYFPPIDINLPEKNTTENKSIASQAKTEAAKAPDDNDDDKRLKIFQGSDHKKFHPRRRTKFRYGKIIHVK
jgi:hypothetical protein